MTVIKDGAGQGHLAKVNYVNMLKTYSTTEDVGMFSARIEGEYYSASTGVVTTHSTNEHILLYLRNDNPDKLMLIYDTAYSYNGGNTNHNRCIPTKAYKNPAVPTANYTSATPQNSNYFSANTSTVVGYKWDETATDGMTIPGLPVAKSSRIFSQGCTSIPANGVPLLGFGNSVAFSVTAEEIGTVAIHLRFFMIDSLL